MKKNKFFIWIGLPTYNEEKAIKDVLTSIYRIKKKINVKIIIFNDGSTDETLNNINKFKRKINIHIINNKRNQGLGIGIFSILKMFNQKSSNNDKLVLMDSDNTHNPNQIIQMLKKASGQSSYVVIASRFKKRSKVSNIPILRNFLTYIAYFTFNLLFHTKGIKDFTSGYRMYDKKAVTNFFQNIGKNYSPLQSFAMQLEIVLQIRKSNTIFLEIPIILDYQKKPTKSKMKILKTVLSYLKLIILRIIK